MTDKEIKSQQNKEYYWKTKASGKCRYSFCNERQDGKSAYCRKHREEATFLIGKRYRRDPITKEPILLEADGNERQIAPAEPQKPKAVPQERGLLSSVDKIEEMGALFERRKVLKAKLEEFNHIKLELAECEKAIAARVI